MIQLYVVQSQMFVLFHIPPLRLHGFVATPSIMLAMEFVGQGKVALATRV